MIQGYETALLEHHIDIESTTTGAPEADSKRPLVGLLTLGCRARSIGHVPTGMGCILLMRRRVGMFVGSSAAQYRLATDR